MNAFPDSNPFTDPSVTNIINHQPTSDVTNFNPFVEDSVTNREAAVIQTNQEVVNSATRDLSRQQESLERAANRLDSWQPDLRARTVIQSERIHNYPPLPPCCPVKPCFYQNISEEIPERFQRIVRYHYYFWIAYSIHLFINVVGCLAFLLVADNKFIQGISFAISIGYLFILIPCSYACWFRPLYKAFRSDSSLNFFWYFLVFLAQIVVLIADSLGIIYYGTVGWVNGFSCLGAKLYGIGIFMLIIGIIFDVLAVVGLILMAKVNYLYRHSGASFELAKQELGQSISSNRLVQEAAAGAGRGAARSATDGVFANSAY